MQRTSTAMSEEYYESPYIHTRHGRFYIDRPTFDGDSIGHALGMLCRFNGNTRIFYSVAEHSILVSDLMRKVTGGKPFEGLMHDGAEAYLSDIPTPFKRLLPDWKKLEDQVQPALRAWAGLPAVQSQECTLADKLALFIEAHFLIPEGGEDYLDPLGARKEAKKLIASGKWDLRCWEPIIAGHMWTQQFYAQRP
jgi:uncharacterized protein